MCDKTSKANGKSSSGLSNLGITYSAKECKAYTIITAASSRSTYPLYMLIGMTIIDFTGVVLFPFSQVIRLLNTWIYVGDSMVIHFRRISSHRSYCLSCRDIEQLKGRPTLSCLDCFRENERCYIIRYGETEPILFGSRDREIPWVRGKVFQGYKSKRLYVELFLNDRLHCHAEISKEESSGLILEDTFKLSRFPSSKSADEVMKTARGLQDGSLLCKRYNLLMNNCEDFANYCKTNNAVSLQVEKWYKRIAGSSSYDAAKCRFNSHSKNYVPANLNNSSSRSKNLESCCS